MARRDATAPLSTILSQDCALPPQLEPGVSLAAVVPPGHGLVEAAASSWRALRGLEDAVVLHWGSRPCRATAAGDASVLRHVCVPAETEWHPGRALNLEP